MSVTTNKDYPLTSEYFLASKNGPSPKLLAFIPGNPGLIDYYVTYLELLAESNPDFNILAVSHAGYQTSDDFVAAGKLEKQPYFNLEYQINHKYEILRKQILRGHTELYILCHSMGAYVTQRVVKMLLNDEEVSKVVKIKFIGLICPTIVDIAKSRSGVAFSRLFNYLPLVTVAVWFISLLHFILPDLTAELIIRKFVISHPVLRDSKLMESRHNSIEATLKIYKSKRIVRQALNLAEEELLVIHRDDTLNDWFFRDLPETHGTVIWSFFAYKDHWVHDNTRDYILTRYHGPKSALVHFEVGNTNNENCPAITHSFCIDQSVEFAEITCKALLFAV